MDVGLSGDDFKVGGVKAMPHPTEMVNLHAVGDGTDQNLVCGTMHRNRTPVAACAGVPLPIEVARPEPATFDTLMLRQSHPERNRHRGGKYSRPDGEL